MSTIFGGLSPVLGSIWSLHCATSINIYESEKRSEQKLLRKMLCPIYFLHTFRGFRGS
jgi:hypothetical protein